MLFSPEVQERFAHFVEYHSPRRLSRNLRKMLLEFLMTATGIESLYLEDLLIDLDGLFTLLDTLDDEKVHEALNTRIE